MPSTEIIQAIKHYTTFTVTEEFKIHQGFVSSQGSADQGILQMPLMSLIASLDIVRIKADFKGL